jgi:hypothetical protein
MMKGPTYLAMTVAVFPFFVVHTFRQAMSAKKRFPLLSFVYCVTRLGEISPFGAKFFGVGRIFF